MKNMVIDKYQITREIGRGGMGIVYEALDTELDRVVALKMMSPLLSNDEEFRKRFRKEAKALAKLTDPNIVQIYDLKDTEQGLLIVMEYVEGMTLAEKIREEGPIELSQALLFIRQLIAALDHAHSSMVIHRDIKPRNILIAKDNLIKMTDFGLAKIRLDADTTVSSATGGTLFYMSPEQVEGSKPVDHRSDIYSLGVTCYEILAGTIPFCDSDSDFTIRSNIVNGNLLPLRAQNTNVSPELAQIIMQAIAVDPDDRFQNVREMAARIAAFENDSGHTEPTFNARDSTMPLDEFRTAATAGREKAKSTRFPWSDLKKVYRYSLAGLVLLVGLTTYILKGWIFPSMHDERAMVADELAENAPGAETADQSSAGREQNGESNPKVMQPPTRIETPAVSAVSDLVLSLAGQTSTPELLRIINEYRDALLLRVGSRKEFPNPEGCYVFVVDPRTVLAVYKFDGGLYRDLHSNESLSSLSGLYAGKRTIWLEDHSAKLPSRQVVK